MDRATPRSNPNYDVYFSDEKIKTVVERCLPVVKREQMIIEHLPSGKSFNNRIYFVNLTEPVRTSRPEWKGNEVDVTKTTTQIQSSFLVLKIAGHPFGRNKVQNEVASLLLLEKHCSSMPAPKLLAWSDDGKKVRTPQYPRGFRDTEPKNIPVLALKAEDGTPIEDVRKDTEGQGWILMTREPGRPLHPDELLGDAGDELMRQIAAYVATWRNDMPPAKAIGNLRIVGSNSTPQPAAVLYDKAILPGYEVHIDGLITNNSPPSPLTTSEKYHAFVLKNSLKRLKDGKLYDHTSDEVHELVKRMADQTLPKLPLFRYGIEPMIFTHDDLSTRNVLVSPDGSGGVKVSAIIDFEFAGFFPKEEEFAGTLQNDQEEWPLRKYAVFLSELKHSDALPENLALNIPPSSSIGNATDKCFEFGTSEFQQAVLLLRTTINTAPWWIKEEKGYNKEQLQEEMEAAKVRVEKAVKWLEEMVPAEEREKRNRRRTNSTRG
ncbi:hypothetical protein AYO21_08423 [Fonsecaea monophora]|uniref:Aminoglycoside phosphotransferase domain-containing protein n=1 Tax=Fonsecaea monophora TaxID=254056 RepID=A0A177F0H6_9EURO|nr:hypothetical protein AYO21_08423 [Fonsecaea monophora]OAG37346.1 hypothetical protein AYO21_08423 [Fonsecaea monophora]